MLAYVLLRLARIYGDDELQRHAVSVLRLVRTGPAGALRVRLEAGAPSTPLLAAARARDLRARRETSRGPRWRRHEPNAVAAFGPADTCRSSQGKARVDGSPTVYVCERFACRAPVTEPDAFDI